METEFKEIVTKAIATLNELLLQRGITLRESAQVQKARKQLYTMIESREKTDNGNEIG